jgi:predicted small integral membrane protein
MIFCWWGGLRLAKKLVESPARQFHHAKRPAIVGLTLGLC